MMHNPTSTLHFGLLHALRHRHHSAIQPVTPHARRTHFTPTSWTVVLVDDGSNDDPRQILRGIDPEHTQLLNQSHAGTTAAWNRGAAAATTPYLVFLNNDTLTTGPWIADLIAPLQSRTTLISGIRFRRETSLPDRVQSRLPTDTFLEGWCFALARTTFLDLGGFDESLALYYSDTDLQARALQHDETLALIAAPDLPIHHLRHRTTRHAVKPTDRRTRWQRDRQRFINKWKPTEPKQDAELTR